MEKKPEKISALEFFKKLQDDKLEFPSSSFYLQGMTKKTDGKEKEIMFSLGNKCTDWISIPLGIVENVKVIGKISCKDHTHPFVQLYFKEQESAEGKAFLSLMKVIWKNCSFLPYDRRKITCQTPGGNVSWSEEGSCGPMNRNVHLDWPNGPCGRGVDFSCSDIN